MKELVHLIQAPPSWLKTPPLSLIYLKNYLDSKGYKTGISDLNIEIFKLTKKNQNQWLKLDEAFESNFFAEIEKNHPQVLKKLYKKIRNTDFVGFSLTKRNSWFSFSLAEKIKHTYPEKKIIFGGPHTYFLDRKNALNEDNFWVIGEGESALEQIIKNPKQKIYRFFEINDLDKLPFYNFTSLDVSHYSKYLPLFSSRGCRYRCNFCSERKLIGQFRCHSPKYLIEQIKILKNKHKNSNFIFCDSLINFDLRWLEELLKLMLKEKLNIKWEAQIRITNNFPPKLARLMKQSGCYNLFIGLESASDKILKAMNKGFQSKDALSFFKILIKARLHFEISLIFGYPQESNEDFEKTLQFIVKNKKIIPKIAQANPFVDYLDDFSEKKYPSREVLNRLDKFLRTIQNENIRYTKSYINNLAYQSLSVV